VAQDKNLSDRREHTQATMFSAVNNILDKLFSALNNKGNKMASIPGIEESWAVLDGPLDVGENPDLDKIGEKMSKRLLSSDEIEALLEVCEDNDLLDTAYELDIAKQKEDKYKEYIQLMTRMHELEKELGLSVG